MTYDSAALFEVSRSFPYGSIRNTPSPLTTGPWADNLNQIFSIRFRTFQIKPKFITKTQLHQPTLSLSTYFLYWNLYDSKQKYWTIRKCIFLVAEFDRNSLKNKEKKMGMIKQDKVWIDIIQIIRKYRILTVEVEVKKQSAQHDYENEKWIIIEITMIFKLISYATAFCRDKPIHGSSTDLQNNSLS